MTIEEWATAYALQFGAQQIQTTGYAEGEREFLDTVAADGYPTTNIIITVAERIAKVFRESGALNDHNDK